MSNNPEGKKKRFSRASCTFRTWAALAGCVVPLSIVIGVLDNLDTMKEKVGQGRWLFTLVVACLSIIPLFAAFIVRSSPTARYFRFFLWIQPPIAVLWIIECIIYAASFLKDQSGSSFIGRVKVIMWISLAQAGLILITTFCNWVLWRKSKKEEGATANEVPLGNGPQYALDPIASGHNPGAHYGVPAQYFVQTSS